MNSLRITTVLTGALLLFLSAPVVFSAARQDSSPDTGAPLPSLDSFLQKVLERARHEEENNRAFQQHYAYKRHKLTEERNTHGKLKKREDKTSIHVPAEETTTPDADAAPDKADPPKKLLEKKDFPLDQEMLQRFRFTIVGRELINGRPAVLLDFTPSGNLKARSFKEEFLNKAAGRLWVDEQEFVAVKIHARLTSGVSIVGRLVGYVKELWYEFDRERTADGFWFVKEVHWHAAGREFLVHKIIDHDEESLELRKVK